MADHIDNTAAADTATEASEIYTLPDARYAPETGTPPAHFLKLPNWAKNEKTAAHVWKAAQERFRRYRDQGERTQLEKKMKNADRMMRASLVKPEGQDDMKTNSNVSDTGYFRRIRTVSTGEASIMFPSDELPAKFKPPRRQASRDAETMTTIANQWNTIEETVFEMDDRMAKIKKVNWATNKYAQWMVMMEWDRCKSTRWVRDAQPGDNGKVKISWRETEVTEKDCSSFVSYDLRNCYFDATIGDDDEQKTDWLIRDQVSLDFIHGRVRSGEYDNAKSLKTDHLYVSEGESDLREDQLTNAGVASPTVQERNGLYDIWFLWIKLPIDDKGAWSPGKQAPRWIYAVFAGDLEQNAYAALKIGPNPYAHGEFPGKLLHSHPDDKGLIHMGFPDLLEDYYWQATTIGNMAYDNLKLRTRAPLLKIGNFRTRDLTWTQNKVIEGSPGSSLEPLAPPANTEITQFMYDHVEDMQNKTAGTDKPIMGEAMGSRTSATEAKNVFDAATRPALEKVAYFTEQLFPWMLRMDHELWLQFGDPEVIRQIVGGELMPELYLAPLDVQVTTINEYESNTLARQTLGTFLGQNFAQFEKHMTPIGPKLLGKHALRMMKMPDGELIFGTADIQDAIDKANDETVAMLRDGVAIQPMPSQNFDVHLRIKRDALNEAKLAMRAGETMIPKANIALLEVNIMRMEQMQMQAQTAQQQQQMPAQGSPPQLEGEATGDAIAAQEGALAQ